MATREDFCVEAKALASDHGIYLWSGNGELTEGQTVGSIRAKESSLENAARVLRFIASCYANGYDMTKSRACDCSGVVVYILRKLALIKPTADYRARDLQAMCKKVRLDRCKPADLVFNQTTGATHVGIYIGSNLVVEAQGRDKGIVLRSLAAGSWVTGGQLPYFK